MIELYNQPYYDWKDTGILGNDCSLDRFDLKTTWWEIEKKRSCEEIWRESFLQPRLRFSLHFLAMWWKLWNNNKLKTLLKWVSEGYTFPATIAIWELLKKRSLQLDCVSASRYFLEESNGQMTSTILCNAFHYYSLQLKSSGWCYGWFTTATIEWTGVWRCWEPKVCCIRSGFTRGLYTDAKSTRHLP